MKISFLIFDISCIMAYGTTVGIGLFVNCYPIQFKEVSCAMWIHDFSEGHEQKAGWPTVHEQLPNKPFDNEK